MSGTWHYAKAVATTATSTPSRYQVGWLRPMQSHALHARWTRSTALTQETLLLSLFWRAAAAAKQAQQVFEAAASRHGFELKLLPKCAGDAAGREQLKAEGAVGHLPYGCTCRADFFFFFLMVPPHRGALVWVPGFPSTTLAVPCPGRLQWVRANTLLPCCQTAVVWCIPSHLASGFR